MAIDKHISGAVEKFEDTAGTSHAINAEYIGGYDAREVFPNYGEVKTANRLSNKGYTGSATWYYPLLKLPVDNSGNYASAIVTGRIGGWGASTMSFCQFLVWNRDGEGITCLHRDGKGSTSAATNVADLVVYRNSDNTTTVYIKCNSYFTYDLNVQTYQSNATIIYNGTYSTTAPTGTLKVSGANATTRLELSKNGAVYNGGALALKSDLTNYQPKGNYVTIDTAQTISAKKTFSATPALSAIPNKKVIGTGANGLIEAHALGIDDITDLRSQLNGKQPSGAYAERQSAQTITGNWTFTGTTNFNGTTKVNGNEIASKGYVDGIFDSKLNASEATNFAKFTKFDSDTLKMDGARLYRTSAGDAVDRSSMYGYSSQNTYGTTYTRFAGMATIGSSQVFIGYYQYTKADGSGGDYIGNITLSNGRLARVNGSLSSVNELTDAYAVLSDLNNKANKTHTHAISDVTNLQSTLNGKANSSHTHSISQITNLQTSLDGKAPKSHSHAISDVTNLQTSLNGKLEFHNQFYGNIEKDGIKVYGKTNINDKVGNDSNGNIIYSAFGQQKYKTPTHVQSGYYTTIDGVFNTGYGTIIGTGNFTPSGNADDTNTADYIKGILITPTSEAFIYNSAKDDAYSFDTRLATQRDISSLQSSINGKQATLVSGTNIKTINGNSILGSGNLSLAMSIAQKSINNDIINATSTKSCYVVIDNWLVQWGVFIGAYGDTTNWEVTFPKAYYWYPAVILQTKDTNTNNQGIPYSNGAVVTSNDGGASFTFQLRRSETCPVYWIAIGGLH